MLVSMERKKQGPNLCVDCGVELDGARQKRRCAECKRARRLASSRAWRERNLEAARAAGRLRQKKRLKDDPEAYYERQRALAKARHRRDRMAALERYGGSRCACCGEAHMEFLTLQHGNGDGREHRALMCGGRHRNVSGAYVRRLRMAGWPDVPGMHVLCANCHLATDMWGGCPHEQEKVEWERLDQEGEKT